MTFDEINIELRARTSRLKDAEIKLRSHTEHGRCNGFEIQIGRFMADITFWEDPSYIDLLIGDAGDSNGNEGVFFNEAGIDYSGGFPTEVDEFFRLLKDTEQEDSNRPANAVD